MTPRRYSLALYVATVAYLVVLGVGLGLYFHFTKETSYVPPNPTQQLMQEHHCWTSGEHPAPKGAVVKEGHGKPHYSTDVRAALEDVFGQDDPNLVVYGFCLDDVR